MSKIKIITDSCSDLSKELRAKFDIDYVAMDIHYDGQEKKASLDWDLYTPSEFYNIMRNGTRITTTQVSVVEYQTVFSKYLEEGYDIIYIGCSSALSGSINTSKIVKDKLLETYPDRKIYCIDSLNSCLGEGMITLMAANMNEEGKSIEEIVEFIEENKLKVNQFCTTDSLEYLRRAGRVKATSAFFGNIIGVKPIIISDAKGNNYAHKKVKGKKSAMLEIVMEAKEAIEDASNATVFIGHADADKDAEDLIALVEKEISPKKIVKGNIGPIIGASVGPGAIVIYCYGKKVEIVGA